MEEYWENNENVAIMDFLDYINQPYSCSQWGIVGNPNLPTIIDDSNYNFHDEFNDIYPANVFIDHEMKVLAILDTLYTVESVNEKIQAMLDNLPSDLAIDNNNNSHIPYYFEITDVYPNPFNPVLNININIAWAGVTQVDILDITGTHIETLHSGFLHSGSYYLNWNAESIPSGLYLVSLKHDDQSFTEKVVMLK